MKSLQEWLGQFLKENDIYFRSAQGQTFPDFYLSESDTKRFFDKYIYEVNNKIVTTYDEKIAEIGFETNVMEVNDSRSRD